jgi:hypothetical protein
MAFTPEEGGWISGWIFLSLFRFLVGCQIVLPTAVPCGERTQWRELFKYPRAWPPRV